MARYQAQLPGTTSRALISGLGHCQPLEYRCLVLHYRHAMLKHVRGFQDVDQCGEEAPSPLFTLSRAYS